MKEGERRSVGRVSPCCQIETDKGGQRTGAARKRRRRRKGFGELEGAQARGEREGEERQFGLRRVERQAGGQAGSSVEPAVLHCGCKLYRQRDQWVAAAEQEGSVLVDYHVCPLNTPGCSISTKVRSGQSA